MRKFLKYTGYTLLAFITFLLLYVGCALAFSRLTADGEPATKPAITIYLKSNGVHADLVLPIIAGNKNWSESILYKNTRSGDTTFNLIGFGWGHKEFYLETPTWADLKASTALKASFGIGASAMHCTFYRNLKEGALCIPLVISNEQYQRLVNYIDKSLKTDSLGKPIVIPTEARYGTNDAFYEAYGRYSLFHTCNTWTNNALKAAGLKACWWTPFEYGIRYQYRRNGEPLILKDANN
jgi:uncharacterized protein (TIGR02117 family)